MSQLFNKSLGISTNSLVSSATGVSYQWLINTANNYSLIAGAIQNSFTPTICGRNYYAVRLTYSGCVDTSISILAAKDSKSYLRINVCKPSYTVPSGKRVLTATGIYADTTKNKVGCDSIIEIDFSITKPISVYLGRDTTICFFGSKTIQAPANATAYLWNTGATIPGISVSSTGMYTVTITNGACGNTTGSINLTFAGNKPQPTVSGTQFSVENIAGANYQWYDCSNGKQLVPGATGPILNVLSCAGSAYAYSVQINQNGCVVTSDCRTLEMDYQRKGNAFSIFTFSGATYQPFKAHLNAAGDQIIVDYLPNTYQFTLATIPSYIYKWDGTQWNLNGIVPARDASTASFFAGLLVNTNYRDVNITDMDASGAVVATVASKNEVKVYTVNGVFNTQKGNTIRYPELGSNSSSGISAVRLDATGNNLMVIYGTLSYYGDGYDHYIDVYNYGADKIWKKRGGTFTVSGLRQSTEINATGDIIAFSDGKRSVNVFKWNGSSWQALGASITTTGFVNFSADALGTTVAIGENINNNINIALRQWNGTTWATTKTPFVTEGLNAGNIQDNGSVKISNDGNALFLSYGEANKEPDFYTSFSSYSKIIRWKDNKWNEKKLPLNGDKRGFEIRDDYSFGRQFYAEESVTASADLSTLVHLSILQTIQESYFFVISGIRNSNLIPYRYAECTEGIVASVDAPSEELPNGLALQVYPNPAGSVVYVVLNEAMALPGAVSIFNSSGVLVASQSVVQSGFTLNVAHLNTGLYIVRYAAPNGKSYMAKLMKE
ncbi:MAG: T9SS type A sorting domain-containing protein [Cytophagales bacterium]